MVAVAKGVCVREIDPSLVEKLAIRCRRCGYSLHGLRSRACPECGQAFNPADPATMRVVVRPALEAWCRWLRNGVAMLFAAPMLLVLLVLGAVVVQEQLGVPVRVLVIAPLGIAALLLSALLLVLCTVIIAWRFRGVWYALGHLFVIVCLMPVFGIGILLVPLVIETAIQDEARETFKAWSARRRALEGQSERLMATAENGRT